jgi:N4-gp56 family major capsid protein
MATSTTSTNAANLHLYYEKKLLSVLEPRLVLMPLGKKQRLPKGNGKQVKWLRYSAIAGSTSPLTEGTPPSEISFSTSNVTADIVQYGQYAKVSDLLSDTAIDPVLENLSERFGIAASKTIDELIVSELANNCANRSKCCKLCCYHICRCSYSQRTYRSYDQPKSSFHWTTRVW